MKRHIRQRLLDLRVGLHELGNIGLVREHVIGVHLSIRLDGVCGGGANLEREGKSLLTARSSTCVGSVPTAHNLYLRESNQFGYRCFEEMNHVTGGEMLRVRGRQGTYNYAIPKQNLGDTSISAGCGMRRSASQHVG